MENYTQYLQPELAVNYCKLLVVTVDDTETTRQFRADLGAEYPFLIDADHTLINKLVHLGGNRPPVLDRRRRTADGDQRSVVGGQKLLADLRRSVLDIVDNTDSKHSPIPIPYTFVLDRNREIYKIYNGWWFVGRPTVEELRLDLRAVMSRRPDYAYQRAWDESDEARKDAFF